MKILHLHDERWDSGISHYAIQIAGLLHDAGHEVVFGALPDQKPWSAAQKRGLNTASTGSLWSLFRLLRSKKWDVVNVHTGRMHSWTLLLTQPGIPVVRTRGDARPVNANVISNYIYGRTSHVIAASAHIARYYEDDFQLDEKKLSVIYPSIEVDPAEVALPKERVGILGRLDPVKGHAFFLEAASHVLTERPQTKFVIAGKEANVSVELLKNQAKELGIESSVEFAGYQPSALEFMKSCSVGVIASIGSEEVSRAALEWMAMGRPLVATLVGCLPELVEPQETGLLVSPGDGTALGEALLKLLREPDKAAVWGRNAKRLIEQKFSAKTELEKTLDAYARAGKLN